MTRQLITPKIEMNKNLKLLCFLITKTEVIKLKLTDFYDIFPEYNHSQFTFRFIRNEIYIIINPWSNEKPWIIIDYYNNDNIHLILKSKSFHFTHAQKQLLLEKYHIFFTENHNPGYLTNIFNLHHDLDYLTNIIKSTK